jgi:hypothetical protein
MNRGYLWIATMDSQKSRYWTIPKAQAAVRATFFSRGLAPRGDAEDVWLRFSEIQRIIATTESPIGDRTLSRALAGLVEAGGLRKKTDGKFSLYGLVIRLPERIRAYSQAEAKAIEAAGTVGMTGDSSEGWAVYGVPEILPKKYRARFRKAGLAHQATLRKILEDVWDEAALAVLRPARGRVPRKVFRDGEKAITVLEEFNVLGSMGLGYGARFWGMTEGAVPGALRAFQTGMGVATSSEASLPELVSKLVSQIADRPIEDVRPDVNLEIERYQKKFERADKGFKPLWEALTSREKGGASRKLQAARILTASLTSVVHA